MREPLNQNGIFIKMNCHPALAPIDQRTIGADSISSQFVYLYKLPVVTIESKTLATAIKWSKGTVNQTGEVTLNSGGYEETRVVYVAHLSG